MSKWLKNILGVAILGVLLWYLVRHWEQLEALFNLTFLQLVTIYVLYFLVMLNITLAVQYLLKGLGVRTRFWDMLWLHNAALLLNYVPMKFGTLFRANYLKRHYGLRYTHFATFFLYITFLMTAMAAIIGLSVLVLFYGLGEYESKILAVVFLASIGGSLLFIFVPLPVPRGEGWFSTMLRNFLTGRSQISKEKKALVISLLYLVANFFLTAVRIGIIYHCISQKVHPGGYVILGALGFVALFIALTPGSLGVKELVLSFGAVALGVPFEVGLLAAMIDRAITFSYAFVLGGSCTVWLWHKSPADFKKTETASATEC
jgi:uncharacterized membrane protein YbhN (UPF0104 family)